MDIKLIDLKVMDESGHRTTTYDASQESGGKKLEREVADLVSRGHAIFVKFPGQEKAVGVASFRAKDNVWIMKDQSTIPVKGTSATATKPVVGG